MQFKLTVKMEDAYTRRTTRRWDVEALDFATALAGVPAHLTALANLSECKILSYTLGQETSYADTVDAGANVDEGVTFSVSIAGSPEKRASQKVPAPVKTIFNSDGSVDLTNGLVTAYAANFLSGLILVSDGEVVGAFESGRLDK